MKEDEDVFEGKVVSKVIQYQVLITFKLPKTNSFFFFSVLVLWTLWERERVGRFGRMALKHVKYHV